MTPNFIYKFISYLTDNMCALNTTTSRLNLCGDPFGFFFVVRTKHVWTEVVVF
jgi:hypothetical protein